jgi:AcrR family transcriptional regulator
LANFTKNRTQKLIIEAFLELISEKNFSSISINDICERSMIHRSTFYRHFTDKYELFNLVVLQINQTLIEQIEQIEQNSELIIEALINFIDENRPLFLSIMNSNESEELHHQIVKTASQIMMRDAFLQDHHGYVMNDTLSISIRSAVYPEMKSAFIVNGFLGIIKIWLARETPYTKEELSEVLHSFL